MTSATMLVAERELRERSSSRAYRIGTLLAVVAVVLAVVLPALRSSSARVDRIAVTADVDGAARDALVAIGPSLGGRVELRQVADRDAAVAALQQGEVRLAVLGDLSLVVKTAPQPGEESPTAALVAAVSAAMRLQLGLRAAGLSPDAAVQALQHPPPPLVSLEAAKRADTDRRIVTFLGIVALFTLLSVYGGWVLAGVVAEKTTRVVEVLLGTIRARQLLVGKVLGIGALALAQAVAVAGAALVAAAAVGSTAVQGASSRAVAMAAVWFVLGYAFYCFAYAAAGSLCSRPEDAQGIALPIVLPLLVTYLICISTLAGTATPPPVVHLLAYLPPTAPIAMPTLVAADAASAWQVMLSIVITVAGTVVLARAGGRIYEAAILQTGPRVKLRTALTRAWARDEAQLSSP